MSFPSRTVASPPIVELEGRFDANIALHVGRRLEEVTAQQPRVVVDLARVSFIDSAALSLLLKYMKRCRQQGGDLKLCRMQQPVRIIFELTKMDRAFGIYADVEQAARAFEQA